MPLYVLNQNKPKVPGQYILVFDTSKISKYTQDIGLVVYNGLSFPNVEDLSAPKPKLMHAKHTLEEGFKRAFKILGYASTTNTLYVERTFDLKKLAIPGDRLNEMFRESASKILKVE